MMLLFAGVGAGIGALIGAASHTESWVPSPSPWLVVRVEPARRRLGAGVRLRLAANH